MCKFVLGLLTKKCKLFLGRDTVMGNLTMTTKYKIFNGLTQPARKCPPNQTLQR